MAKAKKTETAATAPAEEKKAAPKKTAKAAPVAAKSAPAVAAKAAPVAEKAAPVAAKKAATSAVAAESKKPAAADAAAGAKKPAVKATTAGGAGAKPVAKSSVPASSGGGPGLHQVDTDFAAQSAATMLRNRGAATGGGPAGGQGKESASFKNLKDQLAKPKPSSLSHILGPTVDAKKSAGHFLNQQRGGHNQTSGGFNKTGVPRRTNG